MQDESFPLRSTGFMKRRRREYQAAKEVLKEQVKTEIDPVVIEAKKQHVDEIGRLLMRWQKEIEEEQAKGDYEIVYPVESHSLFGSLLSHCPALNRVFEDYNAKRIKFLLIQEKIINDSSDVFPPMPEEFKKLAIYSVFRQHADVRWSPKFGQVAKREFCS
jgi:hypothetical protein